MSKINAIPKVIQSAYPVLLKSIQSEIKTGQEVIQRQRAQTYWKIGEKISRYLLKNESKADYGSKLFVRLAHDLGVSKSTLHQSVKFYREFPIVSARRQFNWTQIRQLLNVVDKKKRMSLLQKSAKENLTTRQLQREIKAVKQGGFWANPKAELKVQRGKLYTYQLAQAPFVSNKKGYRVVDCGFGLWRQIPAEGLDRAKVGSLVVSDQTESWFNLIPLQGSVSDLYNYRASLNYVIDGDTVVLNVDVGFRTWSKQKLRLRGINSPEISTAQGVKAKYFVQQRLTADTPIFIKTYKKDKYDRYLADIFFGSKKEFLNQTLLDQNLATIY
ncbi:hypothetical protein MNBD_BACTEROID05-1200 [hydrothermal vent metagenome]|uniref:TNase-like domain-containing protein n=1 Tax=hydrothermal vent metagenome TaxID=652676 RepID=A0A3B0TG08_9ZZZZ